MSNSIDFVYPRTQAIEEVRQILVKADITITNEKEINSGRGYKFKCLLTKQFGIIIYFKADTSSKVVFENIPNEVRALFVTEANELEGDKDDMMPTVPIYTSVKITSTQRQSMIKDEIKFTYSEIDESQPKDTIKYKLNIKKGNDKFTLTQFKTGTLLLQGTSSPLFNDIIGIINRINPFTGIENSMLFIPKKQQKEVEKAVKKVPEVFENLYEQANSTVSQQAFRFLFDNDKQTLMSAIGILETVKKTNLKIPMYNPILYPFATVFEGFIIRLLIEKHFFSLEDYKKNPDIAEIGNALRNKKFKKYIKDPIRHINILDRLRTVWEDLRCHELHSDPAQDDAIINLKDINQVENRIALISATIMDGYRILVECGYTEEEMLANKQANEKSSKTTVKEIPKLVSRIGTDESGKGDYFGPLVIAGVYLDKEKELLLESIGIQDSKNNSDKKNHELAHQIKTLLSNEDYNIVFINPKKYNELYTRMNNLNTLLAWGHARAIENILIKKNCKNAIADQFGNEEYIINALMEKGKKINLYQTPKGERDVAVAAASILARATFLTQLKRLEQKSGIPMHKGASTLVEQSAKKIIEKNGQEALGEYAKLHFKTTKKVME